MKILVIDDAKWNIASARKTLEGHDLRLVGTVEEAFEVLEAEEKFDAVLTDLHMPPQTLGRETYNGNIPNSIMAGLVFALKSVNLGMRVVICTDTHHHEDYIGVLLDLLYDRYDEAAGKRVPASNKLVAYVEARNAEFWGNYDEQTDAITEVRDTASKKRVDYLIKDWKYAMKASGLFPELS